MVDRTIAPTLQKLFRTHPVVTVTGPRQAGKTTLCQMALPELPYVNLENPDARAYAREDPRGFLRDYPDGVILDEVQRAPELPSYIQPLVDERRRNGLFILTGSQHFGMTQAISQSLAGRTAVLRLLPFSIGELERLRPVGHAEDVIYTGFYPRIHDEGLEPTQALGDYVETYLERDVRQVTEIRNLPEFQRFLALCAGRTGQLLNLTSLGNDAGVSHTTAKSWIGVLEASYILFRLTPYFTNVSKRLIKAPKLYFYDVGLAASLLGIENAAQVRTHPLKGALFENMVVAEALKYRYHRGRRANLHFYRERSGREVDLIYTLADRFAAIEAKAGETITSGYFRGLKGLGELLGDRMLASLVVYAGSESGTRSGVRFLPAAGLEAALAEIDGLGGAAP